ncbi:MAG: DNA-(apurinic or apyrimidinic site) lyase [Candidatus Parvarchaeum acidiphilum ARMAN-4]|uniref:Endonuclease III n=1 Tax=Candidatus Parvarchaeum acidiphilum ARMAN-4 TaxID=662760 RepID=D2EEB9_PARA4|nr:MAG: DNA-(apurinic or apyrimidinic site) lyase [Candidatus Parvarchaeum acidiphilum ARMAN-4]
MPEFILLEQKKAKTAIEILENKYKNVSYYLNFNGPMQLLVAAILSAQTKDTVVNDLTPELFRKYKTVEDFANADPQDLLNYVKKVSFAENKVKNIISCCKIINENYKGKIPNDMNSLLSLPGVGRKTANTILINAFGIVEGIPVDTWVIKLSYRIGLSKSKKPDEIENDLKEITDKKYWKNFAYVIKEHGHQICQSVKPKCEICPINNICPKNGVK